MSLHPQTLRIRLELEKKTKSGRAHFDLYRYLFNPFILSDALKLVLANNGAKGLDGVKVCDIKGKEWDFIVKLSEELKSGRYAAAAVRRVFIPKADGKTLRPLGIPTLKDRVVQRALCMLFEPIYEQKFYNCSWGFRPGRRSVDCVYEVAKATFQKRYVLDADIEAFFDKVVHNKLIGMLKKEIVDPRIHKIILSFLKSGFCEWQKPWQESQQGTPQGGPLSPMLANIYLHYALDAKFQHLNSKRAVLFRFADDFVIASESKTEAQMLKALVKEWLSEVGLNFKDEKTKLVDMTNAKRSHDSKFVFLGFKLHLRAFSDNPKRFWIARQPSEKARKTLRQNLRIKLKPNLKISQAQKCVEETWRGWSNYFRYGNSNKILYKEMAPLNRIIYLYLRQKFRSQRKPVPWRKLHKYAIQILQNIRPPSVIDSPIPQQSNFGFMF